jgi:hypothetical protein
MSIFFQLEAVSFALRDHVLLVKQRRCTPCGRLNHRILDVVEVLSPVASVNRFWMDRQKAGKEKNHGVTLNTSFQGANEFDKKLPNG